MVGEWDGRGKKKEDKSSDDVRERHFGHFDSKKFWATIVEARWKVRLLGRHWYTRVRVSSEICVGCACECVRVWTYRRKQLEAHRDTKTIVYLPVILWV